MMESPKSYTGIYSMHKYWSKKPFNLVSNYIEKYSEPNDVVLDPFCGSGISNVEALLLGRRTVGIDLNPIAVFITRQLLNTGPQKDKIVSEFEKLKKTVMNTINNMYIIKRNGEQFVGSHFIYDHGILDEVWYRNSSRQTIKDTSRPEDGSDTTYKISDNKILNTYLIPNARINTKEGMTVSDLFTPRNLAALSTLIQEINNIKQADVRDFFRFCFTACVGQTSKMVFVVSRRGKKSNSKQINRREVGSWVIGYWIPKQHFEVNVWNCFERRYRKILSAKQLYYNSNLSVSYADNLKYLKNGHNALLINKSSQKALRDMPDNSIDYIITDPPHGDRLPYLELSVMWNTWLDFSVNFDDELVVSDAKSRQKTVEKYVVILEDIMSEMIRVLKPKKYLTLMFNNYDDTLWRSLQEMLIKLRISLIAVDSLKYSANSVVQDNRRGGLKTDFALTFCKTTTTHPTLQEADDKFVEDLARSYYRNHDNSEPYSVLNYIITYLIHHGLLVNMSQIQPTIR